MKDQIEERSLQLLRNLAVAKRKPEKNSGLNESRFQAFFSQLLKLRSNCEDISSICSFIRSLKYMFHIFTFIYSSFTGIFTSSQYDQLPVGLTAQLA